MIVALPVMSFIEQFNEAVTFAQSHEIPWPRDPITELAHWGIHHDDPPPFNRLRGPVHPRGGVSGVICFGMPDQVEHYRQVSHDPKPPGARKESFVHCASQVGLLADGKRS